MKRLLYLVLLIPVLALGQSTDQNYVKSTTYKQPTTTSNPNPDINQANVQVSYFDGLGRPIQQIAHKQSNTGKDIVTHIEYDQFGRQTKDYLPYVSTGASLHYLPSAQTDLLNFYASPNTTNTGNPYFEATGNPFSEKQLDNSPLNRVLKQAAPGDVWGLPQTTGLSDDRSIKFDYQTNVANEVKYFKVVSSWNSSKELYEPAIVQTGDYAKNQLYKTITKDENWTSGKDNTTEEFKDKDGKVVLKRTYNNEQAHDTYYIYDQFGNLTYVIPPLAEGDASQTKLDNLGYQYKYDSRNRLVEKKLPGKQWEFIVYDKLDRPIATGPAYNPYGDGALGWMITEYDAFGRVTQTGWIKMTVTEAERKNNQNTVNSGGNPFTLAQDDILTKNYYDNYSFAGAPNPVPTSLPDSTFPIATNVKGMPTGSWVRVLDEVGSATAETSYTLYDNKYRPVRINTTNFLGGYTEVDSKLDWSGKVEKTVTKHKYNSGSTVLTTTKTFTYSPQDKLVLHIQKINQSDEQLIAKNSYDELGQLIKKEVGGVDITGNLGLQTVDYQYNIRGWLEAINDIETVDDLFAFKINYNEPVDATALYNGNISETYWKTASDNILRSYHYKYDNLNRLLEGNYKREGGQYINSYLEKLSYDKNGNILDLFRNGDNDAVDYEFNIDDLKYFYHPQKANQLMKVTDHSNSPQVFKDDIVDVNDVEDDYEYDDFGNMIFDANKDIIDIDYNHLNLPSKIYFGNGSTIIYLYNATGQKVRKVVHSNDIITTDYLDGFQYHNDKLKHFTHAEGYVNIVDIVENKFKYVFNYTDHLGNVRLSYSDANENNVVEEDEILEENHYYPFGLKHTAYNTNHRQYVSNEELNEIILAQMPKFTGDGSYNYKYNGKEYQDELGLNMYAMDMRQYDPAIARWIVQDPVIHFDFSPYNAFDNNPVFWADPSGEDAQQTAGGWAFTGEDAVSAFRALVNGGGSFDLKGEYSTASGPGDKFLTMDLAAIDFGMQYNGVSILNKVELSSQIYKFNKDGKYSYTTPIGYVEFDKEGNRKPSNSTALSHDVPGNTRLVGHIHTHGNDDGGDIMRFSGEGVYPLVHDMLNNKMNSQKYGPEYRAYVAVPNGTLWKYTPYKPGAKSLTEIISTTIPSDQESNRRNKPYVSPEVTPKVLPTIISSNPNYILKTKY